MIAYKYPDFVFSFVNRKIKETITKNLQNLTNIESILNSSRCIKFINDLNLEKDIKVMEYYFQTNQDSLKLLSEEFELKIFKDLNKNNIPDIILLLYYIIECDGFLEFFIPIIIENLTNEEIFKKMKENHYFSITDESNTGIFSYIISKRYHSFKKYSFQILELMEHYSNYDFFKNLMKKMIIHLQEELMKEKKEYLYFHRYLMEHLDKIIDKSVNNNEFLMNFWTSILEIIGLGLKDIYSTKILNIFYSKYDLSIHFDLFIHLYDLYHENQIEKFSNKIFENITSKSIENLYFIILKKKIFIKETVQNWKKLFIHLFTGSPSMKITILKIFEVISSQEISLSFTHTMISYFYFLLTPIREDDITIPYYQEYQKEHSLNTLRNLTKKIISQCTKYIDESFDYLFEIMLSKLSIFRFTKHPPSNNILEQTKYTLIAYEDIIDLLNTYLDEKIIVFRPQKKELLLREANKKQVITSVKVHLNFIKENEIELLDLISMMLSINFNENIEKFSYELLKRLSFQTFQQLSYQLPKKPVSKYDMLIDKIFLNYPIFYEFLKLISISPLELLKYKNIIQSLLSNCIGDWNSNTNTSLENTKNILIILQNGKWILEPLTNIIEIIDKLDSHEIVQILISVSQFILDHSPKSNEFTLTDSKSYQRNFKYNIQTYLESTKDVLKNHVNELSLLYSKFY